VTLGGALTTLTDPAAAMTLDLPAALPTSIAVGGTALTADGMTLAIDPTGPIDVAITADNGSSTGTARGRRARGRGIDRDADSCHLGLRAERDPHAAAQHAAPRPHVRRCCSLPHRRLPDAASGDLQTVALPLSSGSATSGVFTISLTP